MALLDALRPTMALAVLALAPIASHAQIVSAPIAFDDVKVVNQNRTGVECDTDDLDYTVRGHLTAHSPVLAGPGPHTVTLYTYGFDSGEWMWRLQDVPGYDLPAALADRGHVSVTIDMVGYDATGHPEGELSCMGSQADVHHQIVELLKTGTYTVTDGSLPPVAFDRVVLAGHDVSGGMLELQAYTWPDDAAGLILVSWADQGLGPVVFERTAEARQVCAQGGEPAEPGAPDGYVFFGPDDSEFEATLLAHAEPDVTDAVLALRNRNPCGYLPSISAMLANNQQHLAEIDEPVLLILGADDPVFLEPGWTVQGSLYGSNDVESILVEGASHFPMLETSAPFVQDSISDWLCDRGLVGAGVNCLPEPSSAVMLWAGATLLWRLQRRRVRP